jgi:glycerate kinase
MPRRVLIVPDKFKGTLTAAEAAAALARGWRRVRPDDRLELLPMSDGGDGFGEILSRLLGARPQVLRSVDAAHRACRVRWWWAPRSRTAIVESARVIGLAMLPPGRYHPFELDTSGLGRVLLAAARRGCRRLIVGIGGSATNDGGFGLARSIGWRFLDREGGEFEHWTDLERLHSIRSPSSGSPLRAVRVIVAVDVQNRMLGARGCARVYGPQKGLRPEDLARAEACLSQLARVVKRQLGTDFAAIPGAGAAGGLGFGLMAFAGARVESGTELFARHARLAGRLRRADLVLTGEGALDRSTLMGKGVGELARQCRALGMPCIGLAGVIQDAARLRRRFTEVHALTPGLTTPEQARARAGHWLSELAARVALSMALAR